MDVAEAEARKRLPQVMDNLVCAISDEIIATAEEYEPIESCN